MDAIIGDLYVRLPAHVINKNFENQQTGSVVIRMKF
jgi:hypothetical protein